MSASFPFQCSNCGYEPTPQEVNEHKGDCAKCGDTVVAYTVDTAECILRLMANNEFRPMTTPTSLTLIAAERARQIAVEGWTPEHDDHAHFQGDLARAAACYAVGSQRLHDPDANGPGQSYVWPWSADWWKPTPHDRIRELVKAGALIAAEIDRLKRAAGGPNVELSDRRENNP